MSIVNPILANYQLPPIDRVDYLGGAGGFSGAQLWKVHCRDERPEEFCLRRWPISQADREQLDWIHLVLVHAACNGCPEAAVPMQTVAGSRYVADSGFLWEVTRWMPGTADFSSDPNDQRLANAASCLARFHLGSAQIHLNFLPSANARSRYGALASAGELIDQFPQLSDQPEMPSVNHLHETVIELGNEKANQLAMNLEPFLEAQFSVQPVIGDVWHDHILFTENEVTGIVDFGSIQIDSVAVDLARLLGSMVGDQTQRWEMALEAYGRARPLQPGEADFAFVLDESASFLESLNWLKWILIEQRAFESPADVEKRIGNLIGRLKV